MLSDADGRLRAAHGKGVSQPDIADACGMSQRWVCYRMRQLGLAPNGYGTLASRRKRSAATRASHALRRLRDEDWRSVVELVYRAQSGPDPGSLGGYLLFSALCRAGWPVHGEAGYQVAGVGRSVVVRCPADRVATLLGGRRVLRVGDATLILADPVSWPLSPSPRLVSRLVAIKNATDDVSMYAAVRERLDAPGIAGRAGIAVGRRGVVRVNGRAIVGYEVRVDGLRDRASVRVQAEGIGGRGRFGCGVFVPC